jgi:hypothetical protein
MPEKQDRHRVPEHMRKEGQPMMRVFTLLKERLLIPMISGVMRSGEISTTCLSGTAAQQLIPAVEQESVCRAVTVSTEASSSLHRNFKRIVAHQKVQPQPADAQYVANSYHLNTNKQGNTVQAISDLHQGTFKGITTDDVFLSANRMYSYGEILQLLNSAQYLATHTGNTLDDTNIHKYLATALFSYGSAPLGSCMLSTSLVITPYGYPWGE